MFEFVSWGGGLTPLLIRAWYARKQLYYMVQVTKDLPLIVYRWMSDLIQSVCILRY